MRRLLILLAIAAAGVVAACSPGSTPSASLQAPDISTEPTVAPSLEPPAGSSESPATPSESPAMSVAPSSSP